MSAEKECKPLCIIHFEGKGGELKKIAKGSLEKILERRKQWLNFSSASYKEFAEVAKRSFEFIADSENVDVEDVSPRCYYHPACYRYFTDITKLDRSKKSLATTVGQKRSADHNTASASESAPKRVSRTRGQSLGEFSSFPSRSPHILPQVCLICKRPGVIYFKVKLFFKNIFTSAVRCLVSGQ